MAVAAITLTGCSPEYRFISGSERDVVIKVPWHWTQIDHADVAEATAAREGESVEEADTSLPEGMWVAYIDGAAKPSAAHVIASRPAAPVVVLQSAVVPEEARATLTLDDLRNLIAPVTESARQERKVLMAAQGLKEPKFRLLRDQELKTKTATGVRVVFGYDLGPGEEIYDQVTLTDPKHERVYLAFAHCAVKCYEANRDEITAVTNSLTVKSR